MIEELPKERLELVHQTAESEGLAEDHIRQAVVPRRMLADAQHIAVATVARVDVLVSWNFRHIMNLDSTRSIFVRLSVVGDPIAPGGLQR